MSYTFSKQYDTLMTFLVFCADECVHDKIISVH